MRKNIDLPEETVDKLRILAAKAKKQVKPYIESIIIEYTKNKKS